MRKKWYNINKYADRFALRKITVNSPAHHHTHLAKAYRSKGWNHCIMYLHLGQDVIIHTNSIIGIFDMDTATWSKHTRAFFAAMEKSGQVRPVFDDLPKSCILCEQKGVRTLYISQLSSATLLKRSGQLIPE